MSAPELSIRSAREQDVSQIVTLVNDAYGRTETPSGWTSEDEILAGPRVEPGVLRELLQDPEGTILVAELEQGDDEIVGCAHVQRLGGEPGSSEIGMLSVRPDIQAKGLGRGILEHAEDHARTEQGADRIVLHVLTVREELIAWYQRRGYEPTGATKAFEPEQPQVSLVGDLSFEILEKSLT